MSWIHGVLVGLLSLVLAAAFQGYWTEKKVDLFLKRIREQLWGRVNAKLKLPARRAGLHPGTPAGAITIGDLVIPGFRLFDGLSAQGIEFIVKVDPTPAVLPSELIPVRAEIEQRIRLDGENGLRVPFNGEILALKSDADDSFGLACFMVAFLVHGDSPVTLGASFRGPFFKDSEFIV